MSDFCEQKHEEETMTGLSGHPCSGDSYTAKTSGVDGHFYNADCMEGMAGFADKYFDLAIVDPPFPINVNGGGKFRPQMRAKDWLNTVPNEKYFIELKRVSKYQIIWGGNYFTQYLEPNNKWLVWHKNHAGDKVNFSEAELAYSTIGNNMRVFKKFAVCGSVKWHSCAKPIELYRWILQSYAEAGWKILDTHVGSGSSLIACEREGFDYIGYEIDKDYYKAACKRIERETAQMALL